jgi:6-pyruvoyltetrahydropterin/6-carboxytetrahydropterin synthase
VKLGITDHIDCAHFLPGHPKCGRLHGHTYKIEVIIEGDTGPGGMLLDFDLMKRDLQSVLSLYDHTSLNDFLEYPSVENICELLRTRLADKFAFSFIVRVWEGEGKWAEL